MQCGARSARVFLRDAALGPSGTMIPSSRFHGNAGKPRSERGREEDAVVRRRGSVVDMQEVDNAVNQAIKEIGQRYDFKGTKTEITSTRTASRC